MKLYYVLRDWAIDCDCSESPQVDIYSDLKEAKKKFEIEMQAAITDSGSMCSEDELVEECDREYINSGSALYAVSQEGRWCENHIQVQLGCQVIGEATC